MQNNTSLLQAEKRELTLTTDRMVVTTLVITTFGLLLITAAVFLQGIDLNAAIILSAATVICIIGTVLAYRGITLPGRILVPSLLVSVSTYIAYYRFGLFHISVVTFPLIVVFAGLLLGIRGSFIFAGIGSIAAFAIGYADINFRPRSPDNFPTGYEDILIVAIILFATAAALRLIIQRLSDSLYEAESRTIAEKQANIELQQLQKDLEQRVYQRTTDLQGRVTQLQTIARVSSAVADIQDRERLLPRITEIVSERFEIYHAGIFLIDERGEYAVLVAANSPGGQVMLKREHRLKVGTQGIVGYVTNIGEPRIALDVGKDAVHFNNPDLPETRSELALPLKFAGKTFGALDLQSTQANAFSSVDLQILTILADQVSVAIQNAQSLERSLNSVQEVESAYRQVTEQTWSGFIERKKIAGFEYNGSTVTPVSNTDGEKEGTTIPIMLRGQIIGNLKLSAMDGDRKWTDDELMMAQATAERTALALENARLLEDAQRLASREQIIGKLSSSISAVSEVENILQVAAEELGHHLRTGGITIEMTDLTSEPSEEL